MKNEAMKRTGGRRKSSQSDYPLKGKKTVEIIGEEFGDSAKQVQRYLKLTDLIPELLESWITVNFHLTQLWNFRI